MSVLAEFSMFPVGVKSGLSGAFAAVVGVVRDSGLTYRLTAMHPSIEAKHLAEALGLIERTRALLEMRSAERIDADIESDRRAAPSGRIDSKIVAVAY